MKKTKDMTAYKFIAGLALGAAVSAGCTPSLNQPSTYYVDSERGDDANDGTSPATAWKTTGRASEAELGPGDSLLFRRGCRFDGVLTLTGRGASGRPITVDAYGEGSKPQIVAPDSSLYAVCVANSDYLTLRNLDVANTGSTPLPKRTGVKVLCDDYGTSRNITLSALDIHDVNGSRVKEEGGGSGILIENRWATDGTVSVFDSLTIEDCTIRRCERNAMIWAAPWSRRDWHPSTNIVVRRNLIEEVPGDGIVPIGCDGALVEYNLMRNCPATLPDTEAAAGIWPWSCDNTVIQFNEVSDHKAPWDAQGFDSDYNCTNTTIRYNFSHDNDGGFVLICNSGSEGPGPEDNIGNRGSVIEYNLSINDAVRQRLARGKVFSPTIHIAGPVKNTTVAHNILHAGVKPAANVDRTMINSDSWGGYADNTFFAENVFYAPEPSAFRMGESTANRFEWNYYLGAFSGLPRDPSPVMAWEGYKPFADTENPFEAFSFLLREVPVGDGAATLRAVDKDSIEAFFRTPNPRRD